MQRLFVVLGGRFDITGAVGRRTKVEVAERQSLSNVIERNADRRCAAIRLDRGLIPLLLLSRFGERQQGQRVRWTLLEKFIKQPFSSEAGSCRRARVARWSRSRPRAERRSGRACHFWTMCQASTQCGLY